VPQNEKPFNTMKHYLILALIAGAGALAGVAIAGYMDGKNGTVPAA
jgi:hypothetical protein